jgi:predicted AAA+ superfamily ATPase
MGPRRVGKTVMIYHSIQALLDSGIDPRKICYISVDSPIYNTLSLERLLFFFSDASGTNLEEEQFYVFFDEIQYLKNWENHLKSLIDTLPQMRAVASGSAAAALKLKSEESGAGRFTNFMLPPLTFYEYLKLLDEDHLIGERKSGDSKRYPQPADLSRLNERFIHYLNFGGYPEVIFSSEIQSDPARFIKSDIIDKVLLRDLPSLYGISDIQELNALFTTLAFNTADEISLEKLAQNSGVAKNTLKRYMEYLEAAFLIKIVHRIDRGAKRFKRANYFKIYLTNPSMRAALFEPVSADDAAVPYLTETAIFAQWFHSESRLHYARWQDGEVDMVMLSGADNKVLWAAEVKWSDRYCERPDELESLIAFCLENQVLDPLVTSKTIEMVCEVKGIRIKFVPASVYCYTVGYNIIRHKGVMHSGRDQRVAKLPEMEVKNNEEVV